MAADQILVDSAVVEALAVAVLQEDGKIMKLTDNLIEKLKEIYKDKLIAVILYGSCVTNDCDNAFSDINTIVIIDSLNALDLKNASPAIKDFGKSKNPVSNNRGRCNNISNKRR